MIYIRSFIIYFSIFCIVFTYLLNCVYVIQLISGLFEFTKTVFRRKYDDNAVYFSSKNMIPTSVLVPAYNEDKTIIDNIHSLLNLDYPEFEVIVVNDGSTDETHDKIISHFDLIMDSTPLKINIPTKAVKGVYRSAEYPNFIYVDKENGGKADALNAGINLSSYPIFASVDADSLLEKDSLLKLTRMFMDDPTTVAVGGTVRIHNGSEFKDGKVVSQELPKNIIAKFQIIEYMRAFFGGRMSWHSVGSLLIISGAFGAFRKDAVIECGGYKVGTIGEDMEIILKLHKHFCDKKKPYNISYMLDPVCWTQGPERLKDLRGQRRRWQIGMTDTLLNYKSMLFRKKYHKIGFIGLPYYWVFEFFGTIIEVLGYFIIPLTYLFGELSVNYFLIFLLASNLLGIIQSIGGIILSQIGFDGLFTPKKTLGLTLYAILENIGYRQLTVLYRLEGIIMYRKLRHSWGKIKRQSFKETKPDS